MAWRETFSVHPAADVFPMMSDEEGARMAPPPKRVTVTVEPGVHACHSRTCATAQGRKCNCKRTHQAWVRDPRSGKRIYHRCATRGGACMASGRPRGAP